MRSRIGNGSEDSSEHALLYALDECEHREAISYVPMTTFRCKICPMDIDASEFNREGDSLLEENYAGTKN